MDDPLLELIARSGVSRPSPVALDLLRTICDESHDRARLVRLARQDPGCVTALLRAAAMADRTRREPVTSVDAAVAVLGEDAVQRIVVQHALAMLRVERLGGYGLEDYAFWRMSLATARAAELLAGRLRLDPGTMYVVGLLLDIGKLPLTDEVDAEGWRSRERGDAIERAQCGFDHAEVGAAMARTWGLAEPIPTCVAFHHRPAEAPSYRAEVAVAHVATFCSQWLGVPMGLDAMRYGLDEQAVANAIAPLQITTEQVEEVSIAVLDGLQAA